MIHWKEFDFKGIKPKVYKKRGYGYSYLNIEAGLDIETTSMVINERKTAFMYIWMIGIGHGENVYYGRTWAELEAFTQEIVKHYDLSKKKRLLVYVHNLGYEFQFMRNHFEWSDSFNLKERKPLRATTVDGIEFRDSYILSGYDLEKTAENLGKHEVEKLVGELDYEKIRHHDTPLTPQEMAYCRNDIEIITAYINEQIEMYGGNITKVPLTNTGRVRSFVRSSVYYDTKDHKKSSLTKYVKYRDLMKNLTLTVKEYYLLKKAFQGGFVHSNPVWTGEVMEDVTGIDFDSAYPGVMVTEKFPMSKGEEVEVNSLKELDDLLEEYCVLFRVRFTGLRSKIRQEHYLSESKCENMENIVTSNGRIASADVLETTITDIDYRIIKEAYEWDGIQVADVIKYHKGYLPKDIILAIIELYHNKSSLKGVKNKTIEYLHSKGMLNAVFGMTVTDIVRANVSYKNSWETNLPIVKEEINGYNASKGRFLFYPWGVWTTSYARRNLWTGILTFKDDYLYSDTDGIKLLNYDDHQDYIVGYNKVNQLKIEAMCKYYRIDPKRLSPMTSTGDSVTIGRWDFDGYYEKFKTLGAKRYMVQEGDDIALTVAGVGKRSAKDYMLEQCGGDINKTFEMFNKDLTIPPQHSGNLTHTYIDEEMEFEVTDYLGNTTTVNTKSGVHLEAVEFSLSMTSSYINFIENLKAGFIKEGVVTRNV